MIKISVVIPTYKRPELLSKCLQALSGQTLLPTEYEVIIVADGPDEITATLVNKFVDKMPNLICLQLPEKKGPAAARNMGWRNASGLLIAFTDDDCLPQPAWLQTYLWAHNPSNKYAAYTGAVEVPISGRPTDYEINIKGLETADFVTANCCCTKSTLELCGGFDERFKMAWREDSDLHFNCLSKGVPQYKIHQAVVIHPVRTPHWGISIKEQRKGLYDALLYKKFPIYYRAYIQPQPQWMYYFIILSAAAILFGVFVHWAWLTTLGILCFLWLVIAFTYKRLKGASHSARHVAEMILTSVAIPFSSLYWHFYGAAKYRVLFL